jgi:hypothetical protein
VLTDVVLDEDPFSWPVAGQLLVGRKKKLWYFFPLEELLSHHDLSSPGPPKVPLPTSITLGANTSTYFFSFLLAYFNCTEGFHCDISYRHIMYFDQIHLLYHFLIVIFFTI